MESGFFDFIAHPDIFSDNYLVWGDYCETALKLYIPLEVNAGGKREALNSGKD